MCAKRTRQRVRIGDVVAIPLPDGWFGYGRVYRDAAIGVYDLTTPEVVDVSKVVSRPMAFWTGCFSTAMASGQWRVIGGDAFRNAEEAWPPPNYIQDIVSPGRFEIYHKGEIRPATEDEVQGMEEAKVLKPGEVVVRIMNEVRAEKRG